MKEEIFRPKGVILDMDGLMLETEKPIIPIWVEVGRAMGWEVKEESALSAIGKTGDAVRQLCLNDLGNDFPYDEFHERVNLLVEKEFEKGIALKKGLIAFLDLLSSKNIPFAVATSTRRKWAFWKLKIAGILERFPVIVCGDDVAHKKPAPDVFFLAAGKLGLSPPDCAGFEDSPAGLMALHAAGIRSVFIKDIIEPPENILSAVWRRYNNLFEAMELFTL